MPTSEELLQQAIQAARSGDRESAKKLLAVVVRQDARNARAWYLLSQVVDDPEQVRFCLNKVLEIDPQHPKARQKMAALNTGAGLEVVQSAPPPDPAQPAEPEYTPEPIEAAPSTYTTPEVPGYTAAEMPPAPPQIPYKKEPIKRKQKTDLFSLWLILAMVAVLMFTCCCGVWFAITNNIGGIANQLNPQMPLGFPEQLPAGSAPIVGNGQPVDITLEVNGNFNQAAISWSSPNDDTNSVQAGIPWVKNYSYPSGAGITIMASGLGRGGNSITCVIKANGVQVAHMNSKGANGFVLCMYTVP